MRRLLALSSALLALTMLIPMMGCGGSGSSGTSDSPSFAPASARSAVVISNGSGRAIRVSWQAPAESSPAANGVVEYQIYRAPVADDYTPPIENYTYYVPPMEKSRSQFGYYLPSSSNPPIRNLPGYTLVGTVNGETTTFVDTMQERTFTFQGIVFSDNHEPNQLSTTSTTAAGLTPNRYAYDIRYVYRRPLFLDTLTGEQKQLYNQGQFDKPIEPVRFD